MIPQPGERISLLIVDDQENAVEGLRDTFEDEFDVRIAHNIAEAFECLDEGYPDCALLDIALPDGRGTVILDRIAHESERTRCIMMTGYATLDETIFSLNAGAAAYIKKPFDIPDLHATILEVVSSYRNTAVDRQKLHELAIIRNVGEAALSALEDMDVLLDQVIVSIVDGFQANGGAILLASPDGRLKGAAQKNLSPFPIAGYNVAVGEGIAGLVAARNEPLSIEDVASVSYALPHYIRESGIRAILAAPIRQADSSVGVLLVAWNEARAITKADKDLAAVLGQWAALGIQNASLYRDRREAFDRAKFLADVGQDFNRTMNVRKIVEIVTEKALERLGDGCAVFLKQPGGDAMEAIMSRHRVSEKQALIESHLRLNPVRLGSGAIGTAALTGQTSVVSQDELVLRYPDRPYLLEVGIVSSLTVPLRAHGDIIGAMSFSISESDSQYSAKDLELATEFADRAGLAIENANLLEVAQQKSRDLGSLFKTANAAAQIMELDKVLSEILEGTESLMGADACSILGVAGSRPTEVIEAHLGLPDAAAKALGSACLAAWRNELTRSSKPFAVEDLSSAPAPVARLAAEHGLVSMFAVPLHPSEENGGTLIGYTRKPATLPENQRQLLMTLGAFAGVAIANARSFGRESNIAKRLQDALTAIPHSIPFFDIGSDYHPALIGEASVGGDFYDLFPVGPELYGVVIGDVSGKGLNAATHTAMVKYALRAYAIQQSSPREVLSLVNDAVCAMIPTDYFITLFYAVLDTRQKVVRYASAGHDSPLVLHRDGTVEALESTGRALGLLTGATYEEHISQMDTDDVLLLYTDGVTEARNPDGAFLEQDGVAGLLKEAAGGSASEIVDRLYQRVRRYADEKLHDDIALLALKAIR